ncbi:hypothetical protein XELAEV_18042151mg [Xenopus laevis]|uniref:Uncharacterized protein n=1 Tax=Xenopus laevis TaxID=8355 RepID=A0A974C494_XENLA|nr:hypothetical protein XELAEV_18042151mg [Xenopus laevis]
MRKDIIGAIKWTSYDYCIARDSLELTRWWKIRFMTEVLQDKMKAKAQLKSLYKQLEEINWAIFRKYIETYPAVLPLKYTMIPPVVPSPLHLKYGSIERSTLRPLGRPCIPFQSIPQSAEARVCRLPEVQWKDEECMLKGAHMYAVIFPSVSLTLLPLI